MNNEKMFKTEILDEFLVKNKISKSKFCKFCKISPKTLKRVYAQDLYLKIRVVQKIAKIIGIKPSQFLVED